jgi:hypothetical protein
MITRARTATALSHAPACLRLSAKLGRPSS